MNRFKPVPALAVVAAFLLTLPAGVSAAAPRANPPHPDFTNGFSQGANESN